jgi:hypothetical protein
MSTSTPTSAILSGEQRSARFKYRHSVAGAARQLGIPASWIWAWLVLMRLKSTMRMRKIWVKLEAVQEMFNDPLALRDAFYATGEFLTSPEAIQGITQRWPDEPHPYIEVSVPGKKPPQSVKFEALAQDPVFNQDENSEVLA